MGNARAPSRKQRLATKSGSYNCQRETLSASPWQGTGRGGKGKKSEMGLNVSSARWRSYRHLSCVSTTDDGSCDGYTMTDNKNRDGAETESPALSGTENGQRISRPLFNPSRLVGCTRARARKTRDENGDRALSASPPLRSCSRDQRQL